MLEDAMTRILADHRGQGWTWTSDTKWVVLYSVMAAGFILAWAYVPA
jgi:hypothetical protein